MVDVTINGGQVQFVSSVLGNVTGAFEGVEMVDDGQLHLTASSVTHLLNVAQFTFNGQAFGNALDAVAYIEANV